MQWQRARKKQSQMNLYGEIITSALLSRKLSDRRLCVVPVKYCKIKDVRPFSCWTLMRFIWGVWTVCTTFIGLSLPVSRHNWTNSLRRLSQCYSCNNCISFNQKNWTYVSAFLFFFWAPLFCIRKRSIEFKMYLKFTHKCHAANWRTREEEWWTQKCVSTQ